MPKLYYTPTSCGAASFMAAHTAGVALQCETVNLGAHKTASGADFYAINPKGNGACPGVRLRDRIRGQLPRARRTRRVARRVTRVRRLPH